MTPEDYEELRAISARLSDLRSTAVLSPLHGRAVSRLRGGELKLFPRATAISHRDWDLNEPGVRDFDLIVAANVFMYSGRPREWFDNVLARCAYFLLLDLVRRKRAPDQELGDDGDAMRYAVGDERPRIAGSFDLAALDDRVLCWRTFHGGANDYDDSPMHFVALLRGSRRSAQPTLNRDVAKVIGLLEGGPMPVDQ